MWVADKPVDDGYRCIYIYIYTYDEIHEFLVLELPIEMIIIFVVFFCVCVCVCVCVLDDIRILLHYVSQLFVKCDFTHTKVKYLSEFVHDPNRNP